MLLLTLDTNTDILSCSITKDEKLISETSIYNLKTHSINSINTIDTVLKNSNLTLNELDGFVLSKGPGSFTGLRISFSIIKAFSYSLNKPMIALSSLDALSFKENFNGVVCSIIDALRNEVYINSYENKDSILKNSHEGDIIHIDNLKDYIIKKHGIIKDILFVGDGTINFESKIKSLFPNSYINKKPITSYDYALLGVEKFKANLFEDTNTCAPSYIRVSQAQEMLLKKINDGYK